jgi:hypothetical protein
MKIKDSSLLDQYRDKALEVRKIQTLNLANPLQKQIFRAVSGCRFSCLGTWNWAGGGGKDRVYNIPLIDSFFKY